MRGGDAVSVRGKIVKFSGSLVPVVFSSPAMVASVASVAHKSLLCSTRLYILYHAGFSASVPSAFLAGTPTPGTIRFQRREFGPEVKRTQSVAEVPTL
jgi:hypothetical protein